MDPCDRGMTGEVMEVLSSGGELCVDWRIPRFLDLPCGGFYDSPRFCFHDAQWHLRVRPDWRSFGVVYLSLHRDDDGGPSTRAVTFSSGLRGSGGGVERSRRQRREFEKGDWWYLPKLCQRSELSEQKEILMPGNALTIVCQMKVPVTAVGRASSCPDVRIRTDIQTGQSSTRTCPSMDKQGQQSADECDICCEAPIDCALNPCGHMCWCYNCALKLLEEDSPRCPMCRKSIQTILKLYRK